MSTSSEAFITCTRSLSFACLNIKPSSLGGLIEKAGSSKSSSNFFEIAFESYANKPVVSQTLISIYIAVGINAVASPDPMTSLDELAKAAAPVNFTDFPFNLDTTEVDLGARSFSSHGSFGSPSSNSSSSISSFNSKYSPSYSSSSCLCSRFSLSFKSLSKTNVGFFLVPIVHWKLGPIRPFTRTPPRSIHQIILLIKPVLVNKKTGHLEVLHRKAAEYQTMAVER